MAICYNCDRGYVDIHNGRIAPGGSPIGDRVRCPVCRGNYDTDRRARTPNSAASGGCISQLIGWVFGWIFLGILAFAALAAVVFIPRLFTKHDDDGGSGLVAAESGMGYPADHQVGNCHVTGSWVAVPCDAPHDSQVYALVYIDAAPGSPYPASRDLTVFGRDHCWPQFATFASGSPSELGVRLGQAYPSAAEWGDGIRQVLCGAIAVDGTTLSAPLPLAG